MIVLGLETSCDETAAAVLQGRADGGADVLAHVVLSQLAEHQAYAGVVPEIAARSHLQNLDPVIRQAMQEAGVALPQLDGIAATGGPGLIGGLLVGVMTAKGMAAALDCPFLAVNHLEAHALLPRLTDGVRFPYLLLLVSGGHCLLAEVEGVGRCRVLGSTIDDAVGEAFDKVAKMLGLGYPGGPAVERRAAAGDPHRFAFPRPMAKRAGCDFSFAGLKTAVRTAIENLPPGPVSHGDIADLCASFQAAVGDVLVDRCRNALLTCQNRSTTNRVNEALTDSGVVTALVVAGGVAANRTLRRRLETLTEECELELVAPPPELCTDNAVMVAWAGLERFRHGDRTALDFRPRPRWPLDALAPPSRIPEAAA